MPAPYEQLPGRSKASVCDGTRSARRLPPFGAASSPGSGAGRGSTECSATCDWEGLTARHPGRPRRALVVPHAGRGRRPGRGGEARRAEPGAHLRTLSDRTRGQQFEERQAANRRSRCWPPTPAAWANTRHPGAAAAAPESAARLDPAAAGQGHHGTGPDPVDRAQITAGQAYRQMLPAHRPRRPGLRPLTHHRVLEHRPDPPTFAWPEREPGGQTGTQPAIDLAAAGPGLPGRRWMIRRPPTGPVARTTPRTPASSAAPEPRAVGEFDPGGSGRSIRCLRFRSARTSRPPPRPAMPPAGRAGRPRPAAQPQPGRVRQSAGATSSPRCPLCPR